MPKHQTNDPLMQEVYDHLRDIEGIWPIDGRSTHITFEANVATVEAIIKCLNKVYGKPIMDHPLLNDIGWYVRDGFSINVAKANGIKRASLDSIHIFTFYTKADYKKM